jgi:hypothetical protein
MIDKNTGRFLEHDRTAPDIFAVFDDKNIYTYGDNIQVLIFSGLYDVNHIEICQGDLIEVEDTLYKVMFKKGCFLISDSDDSVSGTLLFRVHHKAKIVGNIVDDRDEWEARSR